MKKSAIIIVWGVILCTSVFIVVHMTAAMTEWDEEVIHQLLEKVTVLSREKIRVTFRDGRKIEQYVAQPKRRKLA